VRDIICVISHTTLYCLLTYEYGVSKSLDPMPFNKWNKISTPKNNINT